MRHSLACLVLAACASSKPAPTKEAPAIRRSIVAFGQKIGYSILTTAPDGTVTNDADIHNNGRGPGAKSTFRIAPDGTLASLDVQGHTELNAPVDEHFSLQGGHASWKGSQETGSKDVTGPAFYIPNALVDVDDRMLAALQKHGGTLDLLPGGTAHLETAGELTVPVQGKPTKLIAYAITGINFMPKYVWAREDGTFFAEVDVGFWFGEEGLESAGEPLAAKQEELRRERAKGIADRLGKKPPAAGFALTHARVLDVEKGEWRADQTVWIEGGWIKQVGAAANVQPPAGVEVIDLGGKALLPGLWDMHAHLSGPDGALDIASGVTTVRDVGNVSAQLDDFKKRFDDGTAVGPHVYRAGFIEGVGKDAAHAEVTATNEEEAKKAVEFFHSRGYEQIKIYNSMDPALVPVLAREAHAKGMGVTGHIPMHLIASQAVMAGYDGVEHINQLLLNFFADANTETRTPLRFSLVGDKTADFDLRGPKAKEFWSLLREHKTVIDPTFVTFEPVYIAELGKVMPGWVESVKRLPAQEQRYYLTGGLPLEGKKELYARSWEKMLTVASVLRDEHVTMVAGTDFLAGFSLHRELELFVQGGLTPIEALRAATTVPASVMKASATSGTVGPGKIADLVVVDGDPLANISDVRKTVMTFRSGVMYPSKELYATVGVSP